MKTAPALPEPVSPPEAAELAAITHHQHNAAEKPAFDRRKPAPAHLTPRQLEVLALLCEGLSNKLICRRLEISKQTVKVHISAILRELGVTSRLQAVVAAHRCGLIGRAADAPTPASDATPARNPGMEVAAPDYGKPRAINLAA